MKTFVSIALGFSMGPAVILLIAAYAWTSTHFKLDLGYCAFGAAMFGALLIAITALLTIASR